MIRKNQKFLTQLYVLFDVAVLFVSFLLAWWLKFVSPLADQVGHLSIQYYGLRVLFYGVIAIILGYAFALYSPKRKKNFLTEFMKIVQVHLFSVMLLLSMLFTFREMDLSREFLVYFLVGNVIFLSVYRFAVKSVLRTLRKKGYNKQFVLILGAGSLGKQFSESLKKQSDMGLEVIGFLDDYRLESKDDNHKILGKLDDLEKVLNQHSMIDEVVIALPLDAHKKYTKIIDICEKVGVRTLIIPDFYHVLPARPQFDVLGDIPLINVRDVPLDELRNRLFKRGFDVAFSLTVLIFFSPLLLLIACLVKLTSSGPVIFKQERVGLNRRTFYMYKFRSMKHQPVTESNTQWTTNDDPRKTKLGTFLRKTSLDELPQFINVLKGDMSVVGPRPERPHFVNQFKEEIPKYMIKHHVRPGITGWAQVNGLRGDTSILDRINCDIFYIENWTFVLDIKIIFKTIINGFINKNAY
ncbi:capsular polysaccharide biosynthesis protein [Halalkalibacter wakoensis JCM 9140]|uniref:Capsular polysaccharide biosynthesis protein n=1 Tax=Halalkalibacter wakoensis JCM 9140 TaxID=1236970 RepID=W4Q2U8_9BACI|nr:undecaprenyl-phosphate glucose phosphotransferase [Halalkalibacter wakoensis]GAE26275.1 capsular polysaccharide biosynthesis protein [Halalkalibacter wakoensis JCM 9140]